MNLVVRRNDFALSANQNRGFIRFLSTSVVEFTNLGGDAILIAPQAESEQTNYVHLAAFVRHAPVAQRQALWQTVGHAMTHRLDDRPVWLSTAGGGVAWLHVRLDNRPKYYGYLPYRQFP